MAVKPPACRVESGGIASLNHRLMAGKPPACRVVTVLCLISAVACSAADIKPPHTDYCKMLERDIEGAHHGFLAGNKLYYVSGQSGAKWDRITETETLGFTHPIFRDGRARGFGIVQDADTGSGHDMWGWSFYRHNKGAYGTLIVDGKEYKHPKADETLWRPDRQVSRYSIGGVKITEEKFISENDVLTDIITADNDVEILFEGESFSCRWNVPGHDGDDSTRSMNQGNSSTVTFKRSDNAIHLVEDGRIYAKPRWKHPAVIGKTMYTGLRFVISADTELLDPRMEKDKKRGNMLFSFKLRLPAGKPVTLTYSVAEEYKDALSRAKKVLKSPERKMADKTAHMNGLLNGQIPYFRCSDEMAVKTYYYLWSLYFMYTRDIGEGYLQYPHTQTAINNFMGLHLWDSWAYTQAGSWVADKWTYGHGNILSWQFMVPFKNKANQMPDNFGKTWRCVDAYMGFVGTVEPAWQQYRRSGDKAYLKEVYTKLFKPLYRDNNGPTRTFGIEVNAINTLQKMARVLDLDKDIAHWEGFREQKEKMFKREWSGEWPGFYGHKNTPWKDIWALVALQSDLMRRDWASEMIDKYIMDTEIGFMSPVGINTRAADSPPNGIFRCSTISLWLGVDGMFRQERPYPAMLTTLNHIKAMTREWGYPVAPEAWEENHKAWGSRYYNWDIAIVCPILEWLAGIDYSIPDSTFKVAPHLPPSWEYIETYTPVVLKGKTHWVKVRVERKEHRGDYKVAVNVEGSPFENNIVQIHEENRRVIKKSGGKGSSSAVLSGKKLRPYKTLAWVTPRTRIFHNKALVNAENLTPGTVLRYTVNGKEPTKSSPVYPEEGVEIEKATDFTFRSFGTDGATYLPFNLKFEDTELQPAARITAIDLEAGLNFTAYEIPKGTTSIPDFRDLKEIAKGTVGKDGLTGGIELAQIQKKIGRKEEFALHITGYLSIPEDQVYNIHVTSDDGSRLFIDGNRVIDLNSFSDKDPWFRDGYVGLKNGLHKVDIYYYQAHYRAMLRYEMRTGAETIRKKIPADAWKRRIR
jgi:hypothetical protein